MCGCVCVCVLVGDWLATNLFKSWAKMSRKSLASWYLSTVHTLVTGSLTKRIGWLPMARETKDSKKWYLTPPCLTLSIIRYVLRVKWSNPGKAVSSSLTPRCSSYWTGILCVAYIYSRQLYIYSKKYRIDDNYTRMLQAILNKSWRQHPTKHQQYGHLPTITKTSNVRRTRHAGRCWRSKDELISDILHMDKQRQNEQLEPIYNSSVLIQDVAWRTFRERWTIEMDGKRGSGKSVLATRHVDDDEAVLIVWSCLTLLHQPSLSSIAFGKSSRLHPVSALNRSF